MRTFLDSSALAKRYVAEPGTDRVLKRCREADEIVLSIIVVPELISAFTRLRREGILCAQDYSKLKHELACDVDAAHMVELTPAIIGTAVECLERFALRSLDALHLATAVGSGAELFVSSDPRQCQAARGLGLLVDEIAP